MYCGHCGKQVFGTELKFCTYCGAALHSFMVPPTTPPEKETIKSRGEVSTDTPLRVSSASSRALKMPLSVRAVAQPMQPKKEISPAKVALTLLGIAAVLIFVLYVPVIPYGQISYLGVAQGGTTVSISYALFGCGEVHVQITSPYGQVSQSEFLCSH